MFKNIVRPERCASRPEGRGAESVLPRGDQRGVTTPCTRGAGVPSVVRAIDSRVVVVVVRTRRGARLQHAWCNNNNNKKEINKEYRKENAACKVCVR